VSQPVRNKTHHKFNTLGGELVDQDLASRAVPGRFATICASLGNGFVLVGIYLSFTRSIFQRATDLVGPAHPGAR
jgi:hypothetical protein